MYPTVGYMQNVKYSYEKVLIKTVGSPALPYYGQIERFRVKHALCRRVKSRSLIVGTGGLRSGAMALPSTDNGASSFTMYGE